MNTQQLLMRVNSLVKQVFGGSQRKLAEAVSLSASTINRTLRPDSPAKNKTLRRNLKQILRDLEEGGYMPYQQKNAANEVYNTPLNRTDITTEERGEAIAIPMANFKASAGNGNYVTETEELDRYVIDRKELGPAAQAALRKKGMILIEVEGDSMLPDLRPGERIIVELTESSHRVESDAVYLIRVEDAIMLKALQRRPGNQLVIISRNDTYPNYTVNLNDDPDLEVIGKVWGRFQRLG